MKRGKWTFVFTLMFGGALMTTSLIVGFQAHDFGAISGRVITGGVIGFVLCAVRLLDYFIGRKENNSHQVRN